ncbi:MAG: DUF4174 domain-containing protein [Myxococcota bacterium]
MSKLGLVVVVALLTGCANPGMRDEPTTGTRVSLQPNLRSHFLKYRTLVLFGADETSLVVVRHLLESHRADLDDRHMSIVEVVGARVLRDGAPTWANADAFRAHYRVIEPPADFTAVLVGKDGGEKARTEDELPLSALFALIDSMPMRKREMRVQREERRSSGRLRHRLRL